LNEKSFVNMHTDAKNIQFTHGIIKSRTTITSKDTQSKKQVAGIVLHKS
jgi:hypothetical protein